MATFAPARIRKARARRRGGPHRVRLWFDQLESRVLLSAGDSIANAVALSFLPASASSQTAHVTEYLADPSGVQLNQIHLNTGDVVTAAVNTSPYGGGLNALL